MTWYEAAKLGDECYHDTRCGECEPNGNCDSCNTIDGRQIECVAEYASTCDGCGNLTLHQNLLMDHNTQLGYCEDCISKMSSIMEKRM